MRKLPEGFGKGVCCSGYGVFREFCELKKHKILSQPTHTQLPHLPTSNTSCERCATAAALSTALWRSRAALAPAGDQLVELEEVDRGLLGLGLGHVSAEATALGGVEAVEVCKEDELLRMPRDRASSRGR